MQILGVFLVVFGVLGLTNELLYQLRRVDELARQNEELRQLNQVLAAGAKGKQDEVAETLPGDLNPARYLIGYASAAFYGLGGREINHPRAVESRIELSEYLMKVCPREAEVVATALHNSYCNTMHRPTVANWEEYIHNEITGKEVDHDQHRAVS